MKVIPSEYWASQATITPLANGSPVTPFEVVCLKFKGVYFSHQDSEAKNNLPKPAFLPGLTGAPSSWDHRSSVGCCWIFREAFTDLSLSLSPVFLSSPGAAADRAGRLPQGSRPGEPEQCSRGEEKQLVGAPATLHQEQQ